MTDDHFEKIVTALNAVTAAMLDIRAERESRRDPAAPLNLEWHRFHADKPIKSRSEIELDQLIEDPTYFSFRQAARRLGENLFSLGGRELMDGAFDDIADLPDGGRKCAILDHAWDGIGQEWHA